MPTTPSGTFLDELTREGLRVDSGGSVTIGATGTLPATKLQVIGDIRVGTAGTNGCVQNFAGTALVGTCASDRMLKKNIQPITDALSKITQLQPVTYEWKDSEFPERRFGKGVQAGLVAQDVEKVLPQLVATDEKGFKAVSYGMELNMLLIAALKEQQAEIEALKARVGPWSDRKSSCLPKR